VQISPSVEDPGIPTAVISEILFEVAL